MITTPASSHFTLLVPVAWALRAAGHEVLVAGQPDVMDAVADAGLNGVTVGDPFHGLDIVRAFMPNGERPIEVIPRAVPETAGNHGWAWMNHARYLSPRYMEVARAFRPGLILADTLEYCSLIIGGALGVPVVHHRWGADPLGDPARREMRPHLQRWCREAGLEELPDPDLILDPCPPSLRLPETKEGLPVRYVPYNGNGSLPPWLSRVWEDEAAGSRRGARIAVSLGSRTLALNGVPHVRRVLRGLGGLGGAEVVATVGPDYRDQVGPLPDNVRLVDPVPLNLLLPVCDAMVHHGGGASTLTATWYGLPQLALPQMADQFAHGDMLTETGAGLALDSAEAQDDPDGVGAVAAEILSEPAYRSAVAGLREEMERMPAPTDVVDDLESLAGGAAPCA